MDNLINDSSNENLRIEKKLYKSVCYKLKENKCEKSILCKYNKKKNKCMLNIDPKILEFFSNLLANDLMNNINDRNNILNGIYIPSPYLSQGLMNTEYEVIIQTDIDKNPVDAVFFLFEFGGKIIKKTGTTVKKKTGDVFSSVKKSIKAESTYANALVNSNRLDEKINNDDSKKFKKQGYYSLILIELEKN